MLLDRNHQISGTHAVQRVIRFRRPAFLVSSSEDFRSVVKGACGYSGGVFCHLIPAQNGQLSDVWSSYIQRLLPDDVYIPDSLVDLKPELQKLVSGHVQRGRLYDPCHLEAVPQSTAYYTSAIQMVVRQRWGPATSLTSNFRLKRPLSLNYSVSPASGLSPRSHQEVCASWMEKQLRDLVHIVPPASGRGLAAWLFSVPRPNPRNPVPPYLAVRW